MKTIWNPDGSVTLTPEALPGLDEGALFRRIRQAYGDAALSVLVSNYLRERGGALTQSDLATAYAYYMQLPPDQQAAARRQFGLPPLP